MLKFLGSSFYTSNTCQTLCVCQLVCLSVHPSVRMSAFLFVCIFVCLSALRCGCKHVAFLSVCPAVQASLAQDILLPLQELHVLETLPFDDNIVQFHGSYTQHGNILLVLEYMQVRSAPHRCKTTQ